MTKGRKVGALEIQRLLAQTITTLCNNAMSFEVELSVEGLLGITLDNKDVVLVNIKEIVKSDISAARLPPKCNSKARCSLAGRQTRAKKSKTKSSPTDVQLRNSTFKDKSEDSAGVEMPQCGGGQQNLNHDLCIGNDPQPMFKKRKQSPNSQHVAEDICDSHDQRNSTKSIRRTFPHAGNYNAHSEIFERQCGTHPGWQCEESNNRDNRNSDQSLHIRQNVQEKGGDLSQLASSIVKDEPDTILRYHDLDAVISSATNAWLCPNEDSIDEHSHHDQAGHGEGRITQEHNNMSYSYEQYPSLMESNTNVDDFPSHANHLYQCQYCSYVGKKRFNLERHMARKHIQRPPTECPVCKKIFRDEWYLRYSHIPKNHPESLVSMAPANSEENAAIAKEVNGDLTGVSLIECNTAS